MNASYNKIDYRIRVAKSVERRMICALFQHLNLFYPLNEYKYIGFGSVSFLDFALFHKVLGIDKMISIEREEHDRLRFEFNKPYQCIDLKFGEASDILPALDIENKSLIWLDYDDKLNTSILSDISLMFNRLTSGSFLCISYNAQQDSEQKDSKQKDIKTRLQQLSERIDTNYFPDYLHADTLELNKKNIRKAYYDIVSNLITDVLSKRNANGDTIQVQQMLFFSYNDGAEMNTLGWLFYDTSHADKVDILKNSNFSFLSKNNQPFEIAIPSITFKEMQALETKFPDLQACIKAHIKTQQGGMLRAADIENYYKIYKHFSLFAEIYL